MKYNVNMDGKDFSYNRDVSRIILEHQNAEQKLDSLEKESRSLLELNPEYGRSYILHSFRRKHANDAQRTS